MTIEQRPELNRYVDPSIPLTWEYRWRLLKIIVPMWVFTCAFVTETALYRAWLSDRLTAGFCLTIFGACVFILCVLFGGNELQVRIRQRSKRTIQFKKKKIVIQPARDRFIPWKKIK